jgi:hypothetical protein
VYLLGRELLACGLLPEELADVAPVHRHTRDHLVALADLVLDLEAHRSPQLAQPGDRLPQALMPLRVAGRRLVVDELGMNQVVRRFQVALLEELLE